jgi:hypothetical protein
MHVTLESVLHHHHEIIDDDCRVVVDADAFHGDAVVDQVSPFTLVQAASASTDAAASRYFMWFP